MDWTADCPLCRLCRHGTGEYKYDPSFPQDLKTRLIYEDADFIVVLDLNPRGWSRRYLGVPKEHIDDNEISVSLLGRLVEIAVSCASSDSILFGGKVTAADVLKHTIKDHSHVQVCVRGGPCE